MTVFLSIKKTVKIEKQNSFAREEEENLLYCETESYPVPHGDGEESLPADHPIAWNHEPRNRHIPPYLFIFCAPSEEETTGEDHPYSPSTF